jgi:(2R)-3-sulfolactate dehydrogenase (NADP+)
VALAGSDTYFERVETLVAAMLVDEGVRLPGERRHAAATDARERGIELPEPVYRQLVALAD